MSVAAMASCWGADFPSTGCETVHPSTVRLVALAIADVVNDLNENLFYAKLSTVATKVEVHRNTVRKVMRHLVEVGVLRVIDEAHPGSSLPGVYRWVWITGVGVEGGRAECATSDQVKRETPDGRSRNLREGSRNSARRGSRIDARHIPIEKPIEPGAVSRSNACDLCDGTGFLIEEIPIEGAEGNRRRRQFRTEAHYCECHPLHPSRRPGAPRGYG